MTLCLLAPTALTQTSVLTIAQERYQAGETVRFAGPAGGDLFLAGNRVEVASAVGGAAHLAGRRVTVEAVVAGDLFAAGYAVVASGTVGGDASLTGYEVAAGPVTGNLRAAGAEIELANLSGYSLVTAANITLTGAVAGHALGAYVLVAGWFFVLGLTLLGIGTLAAFVLPEGWLLRREAPAA